MAAGLKVLKDTGEFFFDTTKISYGLLKSGYLADSGQNWYHLIYRSAQLDPNDRSSWTQSDIYDRVFSFSVSGAVAPIVFINGPGISVGESYANGVTTFLFIHANASTKFFYFDTMRNTLSGPGLKCYDENGTLTFNSLQTPLNIINTLTAPAPPAPTSSGGRLHYTHIYNGATMQYENAPSTNYWPLVDKIFVPIGSGNFATSTTFGRSFVMGYFDNFRPFPPGWPNNTKVSAYSNQQNGTEGSYGGNGGIYWIAREGPCTTEYWGAPLTYNRYTNLPVDRFPSALVINIDSLPFPFN